MPFLLPRLGSIASSREFIGINPPEIVLSEEGGSLSSPLLNLGSASTAEFVDGSDNNVTLNATDDRFVFDGQAAYQTDESASTMGAIIAANTPFTIEALEVMTTDNTKQGTIAACYNAFSPASNRRGWWLLYQGNIGTPELTFLMSNNGSSITASLNYVITLTNSQLYDITVERDSSDKLRMYVDGVMVDSDSSDAQRGDAVFSSSNAYGIMFGGSNMDDNVTTNFGEWIGDIGSIRMNFNHAYYASDTTHTPATHPFT